jgi:hypothetical protein
LSSKSHSSARSDLANVTSDHRSATGWDLRTIALAPA